MKKASVLFTTALVLSTIVLAPVAHAVDVDKQIEETETKLNEIKASQSAVEAELARIDSELAGLESEAAAVQADIAAARERLGVLNQEIAKLEENIVKRTEKIAEQARTIQLTGGEINYFSILTSSESFAEVVSKYNAANEFMTAGQHLRDQQVADKAAVDAKRVEVEQTIEKSNEDAYRLENLKEQVYQKQLEQTIHASELSAQRTSVESDRANFIAQKEAAERELAAAQAAATQHAASVVEQAISNPLSVAPPAAAAPAEAAPAPQPAASQAAPAVATPVATQAAPQPAAASAVSSTGGAIGLAKQYLGVPYRWGGSSPAGFDCSGLVQYVYRQLGVSLPRTTYSQEYAGTVISVSEAQPGDLIFWGSRGATYHVAIYMGNGQFIHAPSEGGSVEILSISSGWAPSFAVRL